jgi:molybdopterin molybdotransferase
MAKSSHDCFRPGEGLMPLAAALALLDARLQPVAATETVALAGAPGRTLAEDVTAAIDVPPRDNSAVDGYAVRHADLNAAGESRMPVRGRIAAGAILDGPGEVGAAYRIFTGAPMPQGFDSVFMQENCMSENGEVILPEGLKPGANRRHRGEDVRRGSVILKAGRLLRPPDIGLAASVGMAALPVYKPLRCAVFSTGDEVFDPPGPAPAGGIFDANRYTLMGLLGDMGCLVTDLGILADNKEAVQGALAAAAADHDLIITSGGVSIGDEDHVRAAVAALGGIHFWRLAIKPGRPVALGRVGDAVFAGLPGNPAAAVVTFFAVARPVILKLSGRAASPPRRYPVRAGFDYKKKAGRLEWVRARLEQTGDGLSAVKFPAEGSGILTSIVESDGLVELAEDLERLKKGEMVDFLPFNELSR